MAETGSTIPNSLMIALDKRHHNCVVEWWATLTEKERAEFLEVAASSPADRFQPVSPFNSDSDFDSEEEPNEWYEYLVNQDVRFYFDRSDPQGNYNIVYPIISPISTAADIEVVSHLLTNPRRQR